MSGLVSVYNGTTHESATGLQYNWFKLRIRIQARQCRVLYNKIVEKYNSCPGENASEQQGLRSLTQVVQLLFSD